MKKRIFQIFAVIMILGLLAGSLSPILLGLGSSNSSDVTNQDPNLIQVEPGSEETVD